MSYKDNKNLFLEDFFTNKNILHRLEDYIRYYLLNNNKIHHFHKIFLSRIMYGRIVNSKKNKNIGKLDACHAKAQMITCLCIAFYLLNNDKNNKNDNDDLFKLLNYHIQKIEEYIAEYNDTELYNIKYNNHFIYCKKWIDFHKITDKYNEIKLKSIVKYKDNDDNIFKLSGDKLNNIFAKYNVENFII
jgi:hypothetical protein